MFKNLEQLLSGYAVRRVENVLKVYGTLEICPKTQKKMHDKLLSTEPLGHNTNFGVHIFVTEPGKMCKRVRMSPQTATNTNRKRPARGICRTTYWAGAVYYKSLNAIVRIKYNIVNRTSDP